MFHKAEDRSAKIDKINRKKYLPQVEVEQHDAILRKNLNFLLQAIDDLGAISNTV